MTRIRNILVPVDLSGRALLAVREAASLADKFGARLLLLHAVESTSTPGYQGGESPGELEAYAAEALRNLTEKEAPEAQTEVLVVSGDVDQSIHAVCTERSVDLIVMMTRGEGTYRRFLLGSNTAKALHDLPCPVLTTAHQEHPEQACYPYQRIACLLDLRGNYRETFTYAKRFAESYEAELTAVYLAPAFLLDDNHRKDFAEALEGSGRLLLEKLIEQEGANAQIVVKSGGLEDTLPQFIEHGRFDLLVVSRKHAGVKDQRVGVSSQAYEAIRCSPCPVLSI